MSEENNVGTEKKTGGGEGNRPAVAFLVPSYKTPFLTSDLFAAALASGKYADCAFILLLEASDPHILKYRALVENVREKGLAAGYFIFDGTPYCGQINRVAPLVPADAVCVIDAKHLPVVEGPSFAESVRAWLATSPEPMRVGTFCENGLFPLVTPKLIERMGYLFHPLCYGRTEAEEWVLSLGSALGIVSAIPGGSVIESSADGVEIIGVSSVEDTEWASATLEQILEEETERLSDYLVR